MYLFFLFVFFSSVLDANGQTTKNSKDSIRTLTILKNALNNIINENKMSEDPNLDLEIDGLLIDETRTKVGRDFYDMFFALWVAPKKVKNYSLTIKEMVIPGLATEISVVVNESIVFKQRVQPRYEVLLQMTKYANHRAVQYINSNEKVKNQLDKGDQHGSGIF